MFDANSSLEKPLRFLCHSTGTVQNVMAAFLFFDGPPPGHVRGTIVVVSVVAIV